MGGGLRGVLEGTRKDACKGTWEGEGVGGCVGHITFSALVPYVAQCMYGAQM